MAGRSGISNLSPEERKVRAKLASQAMWARNNGYEHLAPARAAFMAKFEKEVDPEGALAPDERARRAEHAKKAYFLRLTLKAQVAKRKKREAERDRIAAENEMARAVLAEAADEEVA